MLLRNTEYNNEIIITCFYNQNYYEKAHSNAVDDYNISCNNNDVITYTSTE